MADNIGGFDYDGFMGSLNGGNTGGLDFSWADFLFGGKAEDGTLTNGMLAPTVGAANDLMQAWLGFQQYGLAKDQFDFSKQAWHKNYANQVNLTNQSLANQQARRLARSGQPGLTPEQYVAKHGIGLGG